MIFFDNLNKGLNSSKLSVMNFLNEITGRYPNAISFAPGRPLEDYFNVEKAFTYVNQYVEYMNTYNHCYSSLGQYGNTKGLIGDVICQLIANDEGIIVGQENVLVTVGCQEAICLSLLAFASNPGDVVLVEDPAYVGLVGAAQVFGVEVVGVPTNENGIVVEMLHSIIAKLKKINKIPRLLYVSPDFSNPTGFTSNLQRRIELLNVTRELGLIVLEDNAYSYFFYNDIRVSCLKSLPCSEHVIYLGSFSKSIYPGVRIGFLVADQKVDMGSKCVRNLSDELSKIKSFLTVNSSPINQAIVGGLIIDQQYSLISYTKNLRSQLKSNRDAMLAALTACFPRKESWCESIEWNTPAGGFFITLKLPFNVSDSQLYSCAQKYGVIWTPMSYFYLDECVSNSIRLSFSYVNEIQIIEGIKRLSEFVKEMMPAV
jgi:(S)-3,5-dihydroxyphenylglycine transaminase